MAFTHETGVRVPVGELRKFFAFGPLAQWIAYQTSDLGVAGSSPAWINLPLVAQLSPRALVAQWIARWTSNPKVAGSSPA